MKVNALSLNLAVGQEILVGNKNDRAKITKIEFHEKSGEVELKTTKGPRKTFTFKLSEQSNSNEKGNPADKYR